MDERIILFSKENLAINCDEKRIIDLIELFSDKTIYEDINDVIELYNVKLFFSSGGLQNKTSLEKLDVCQKQISRIGANICRYFSTITDENAVKLFLSIEDYIYKEYFWDLFDTCDLCKKVSSETFATLFECSEHKDVILRKRKIVKHYDNVLAELLKSYALTAELFLSHFEMSRQNDKNKMFFPESLSLTDKDKIVLEYLESEICNLNYLKLAVNAKDYEKFKLSDKTRLYARKKYSAEMQRMHDSESCAKVELKTNVVFSKDQQEPRTFYIENDACVCSYSALWIKQHNTEEQLFFNLKYLFEFIDQYGIISLVPHIAEIEILDVLGLHSDNEYNCSASFQVKNQVAMGTFVAYKQFLLQDGMMLETIIENVFNNCCKYAGIENMSVNVLATSDTLSKIRFITPELEAVLKKFKIYVENGFVDLELLTINSSPTRMGEIPSSVERKYIYCVESVVGNEMFELFSKQSLLRFNFDGGGKYKNMYEFLLNESVDFNSIKDFQKDRFENLLSKKYLCVNNGSLKICDGLKMSILNELYSNDAISYWFLPNEIRKKIDLMVDNGELCFKNTLFTKEETEFFNYYLNKTFGNGEDLRNKYVHGTHSNDNQVIEHDYNCLLLLFSLVLLKILEDILCCEIVRTDKDKVSN